MKGIGLGGPGLGRVGLALAFVTCVFACGQPEPASSQSRPGPSVNAPTSRPPRVPESAPVAAPPPAQAAPAGGGSHVVRPGETLATIARDHYGSTDRFRELYEANRDQIQDPDVIYPGQEFVLP